MHLVVQNGDMRFILLELIFADLPPPVQTSSGPEWQYEVSFVTAHIGRSTGRYQVRHPVVQNGDIRFILLELILADELADIYNYFYC